MLDSTTKTTVSKEEAQALVANFKPWVLAAYDEKRRLQPGETMYIKFNSYRREWVLAARYYPENTPIGMDEDEAKWRPIMTLGGRYQAQDIYDANICMDWHRCLVQRRAQ